jgi:hypothetical protein
MGFTRNAEVTATSARFFGQAAGTEIVVATAEAELA